MAPTSGTSLRQSRWGFVIVLVICGLAVGMLWPRKWLQPSLEPAHKDSREAKAAAPGIESPPKDKKDSEAAVAKPVGPAKPGDTPPASTSPPESSSTAAPAEPPPWQQALDDKTPPPDFAQLAFSRFEESFTVASPSELAKWFEATPGSNLRIGELTTNYGKCGTLEGIGRLKCPWLENTVLRLQMENFNRLQMHFFHGNEGVTFVYYEDQSYRWAAYATTRADSKAAQDLGHHSNGR